LMTRGALMTRWRTLPPTAMLIPTLACINSHATEKQYGR
jgi:hypothetical protein